MKHRVDTELATWQDMLEYESTLACECGTEWRGLARVKSEDGGLVMLISAACPKCNSATHLIRVSSDPEVMTIRG